MTAEAVLISLLPVCALAALLLSVGRLVYVFAVPYVDVEDAELVRRGPGSRTRLLALAGGAAVIGGLLIYGSFVVFTTEDMPGALKLAAYFALVFVAGGTGTFIFSAVSIQNRMADEHEFKVGRGHAGRGRLWRSNLIEVALLFFFAVGVFWVCGLKPPDPGNLASLPADALKVRVNLLHFVAIWTFLAGAVAATLRIAQSAGDSATGKIMLSGIALSVAGSVFKWIYSGSAPTDRILQAYARGHSADDFITRLAQAEAMALIGVALILLLVTAPVIDLILRSVSPGLKPRFGRMLSFIAAFAFTAAAFAFLGASDGVAFRSFLMAAAVGIALAIGTPLVIAAITKHPLGGQAWPRWIAIGAAAVLAILVLMFASSFEAATALLAAAGVLGAGAVAPEPEAVEPSWQRVF